jgi:enterobactin synthetase component D
MSRVIPTSIIDDLQDLEGIRQTMDRDCCTQPGVMPPLDDEFVKYVALSAVSDVRHILHPDEARDGAAIVHTRRREEFFLGRTAAHHALLHSGIERITPIRRGLLGEPIWPEGFVGSITHCHPWTIAAVAEKKEVSAIGIDLESMERVQVEDVRTLICCPSELDWIASGNPVERLTILFSAKEAIFKAVHPSCHRYFGFLDVEVVSKPLENKCVGTLQINLSEGYAKSHRFDVHYSVQQKYVFAYLIEKAFS